MRYLLLLLFVCTANAQSIREKLQAAAVLMPLPKAVSAPRSVLLAWDPSPSTEVVGYRIYYGPAHNVYTNSASVGNTTNATVTGLLGHYYFAATAYNAMGDESPFSNETSYTAGTWRTNLTARTFEVSWPCVVNRTNTLQRTGGNIYTWLNHVSFIGTNGTARVVITNDMSSRLFRVRTAGGAPVRLDFRVLSWSTNVTVQ